MFHDVLSGFNMCLYREDSEELWLPYWILQVLQIGKYMWLFLCICVFLFKSCLELNIYSRFNDCVNVWCEHEICQFVGGSQQIVLLLIFEWFVCTHVCFSVQWLRPGYECLERLCNITLYNSIGLQTLMSNTDAQVHVGDVPSDILLN